MKSAARKRAWAEQLVGMASVPKTKQTSCPDCGTQGHIIRHKRGTGQRTVELCGRCKGLGMIVVPV